MRVTRLFMFMLVVFARIFLDPYDNTGSYTFLTIIKHFEISVVGRLVVLSYTKRCQEAYKKISLCPNAFVRLSIRELD